MSKENISPVLPSPTSFLKSTSSEHIENSMSDDEISPVKHYRGSFNRINKSAKKTAIRIEESVSPVSKRKYDKVFGKYIENLSPIKLPGSPNPIKDRSPYSVITQSGKKLNLRKEYLDYSLYDDTALRQNELQGEELKEFLSVLFEGVTEIENLTEESADIAEKKQSVVMTQEKRDQHAKEARVNGRKVRDPDQRKVMAKNQKGSISATEIVEKYFQPEKIAAACDKLKYAETKKAEVIKQFSNISVEWLHLIDFGNLGNDAQKSDNLVLGTVEANSQMMIVEELTKRGLKKGETITTETTTKMFKFHIPYEIEMKITYNGITKSYMINPFTRQKPIIAEVDCEDVLHKAKKKRLAEKTAEKKAADEKSAKTEADAKLIDLEAFKSDASDLFAGFSFATSSAAFFSTSSSSSASVSTPISSVTKSSDINIAMGDEVDKNHGRGQGAAGSLFSSSTT